MKTFKLSEIKILPNRQRTDFDTKSLRELADNIYSSWNIQLPGVFIENDTPFLVWGERRFRAIALLASEGKTYRIHNGHAVPLGHIAVETLDALATEVEREEVEYSENVHRVELPWPNRVKALSRIHEMRKALNPKQTIIDTAREIAAKTNLSVTTLTKLPSKTHGASTNASIPVAIAIAPHLNDPEVAKATSVAAAFAIVAKKAEAAASAALIKRRRASGALSGELIELRYGDAKTLILDVKDKTVDLIFTDPPYGVDADTDNFNRRFATKHTYADDPLAAKEFMQWLLLESFRVAKDRANLFMFCDSKHYDWLRDTAARAAWSPYPRPLIWDKLAPGIGPWQDNGFGNSYEMIFFATKGRRGLNTTIRDVLPHKRVTKEEKIHAAQKPDSLLRQLIAISTLPGEFILDPCAGSGSTLLAARALQRYALGFETDKDIFELATTRILRATSNNGQTNATSGQKT